MDADIALQIDRLIMVAWVLLIPIGVLLALLLAKLVFLLHGVSELMTLARYELYPALKDIRQIAERANALSEKAVTVTESIEHGVEAAGQQMEKMKQSASETVSSLTALSGPVGSAVRAVWLLIQDDRKRSSRKKSVVTE